MYTYLCGPINNCSDEDCKNWREQVKLVLPNTIDPMDRDYRGQELEFGISNEIVINDKKDISNCDYLLVYYNKPSVGTSMEILFAYFLNKKIILVDKSSTPLSPWLIYHCSIIVKDLMEGIKECG